MRYPDIQFHFLPVAIRYDGKVPAKTHGFQAHVGPMRSASRGSITLRSAEPKAPPKILFNYMSTPEDWADFRHCIRLTREIFSQAAFAPYRGDELSPGPDVRSGRRARRLHQGACGERLSPSGTCRVGQASDPMAVVDPTCRVIGVDNLRLADSAIFPRIPNGNLNGPSIMVGEKASDHILNRTPLPRSNKQPWINPKWQERDR